MPDVYSATPQQTSTCADEPTQINLQHPGSRLYPKRMGRPKTAKGYLPLFKKVVLDYIECITRIELPGPQFNIDKSRLSDQMIATINYKVDIEESVWRILRSPQLWSAWCSMVRHYGDLGDYNPVPAEIESSIILALSREWEYLSLDKRYEASGIIPKADRRIGHGGAPHPRRRTRRRLTQPESRTPEYRTWCNMHTRCYNAKDKAYKHYGGRGIKVAPEFRKYSGFLAEVGRRPSDEYSLDRIDNDGDYAPGNIRWLLRKYQNANRRDTSEWTSTKERAATRAAQRAAFLAVHPSSRPSFDALYLKAVDEQEITVAEPPFDPGTRVD
jgi:hypothetical protein